MPFIFNFVKKLKLDNNINDNDNDNDNGNRTFKRNVVFVTEFTRKQTVRSNKIMQVLNNNHIWVVMSVLFSLNFVL